jgi:hypothetical protein
MGRWRTLQVQSVQEAELCACLGQERGERQQRAGQADERIARSGGAEVALVVVLELWEGAQELARLAQSWKMESQVPEPGLKVEVVERSPRM